MYVNVCKCIYDLCMYDVYVYMYSDLLSVLSVLESTRPTVAASTGATPIQVLLLRYILR